jgi:parallel beta-helix repeat protein
MRKTVLALTFIFMLSVSLFYGLGAHLTGANVVATIFIREDGSVEGTDKIQRDGNVYTVVADLNGAIRATDIFITIEKDGVVFDGGHRKIQGTGNGVGIAAYGRKDITIKSAKIVNFGVGIELRATDFERNTTASNNQILDNYLDTTYFAINLNTVSGTVTGNTIVSRNSRYGVFFDCNSTVFSKNSFVDGGLIVYEPRVGNVLNGNTINGKPLVYLEGQSGQIIDGAAQVILTDCRYMTIKNVDSTADLRVTITLFGTSNTVITKCRGNIVLRNSHSNMIVDNYLVDVGSMVSYRSAAIELSGSDNNTIADNSILATGSLGVSLFGSSYNSVRGNQISSTGQAGVIVESTITSIPVFNYIHENSITCTENGIYLNKGARNNFVFKNLITDCKNAIMLSSGHENTFVGNNISRSMQYAVYLAVSDDNIFYHNNFVDNAVQAFEQHEFYSFPGPFSYYSERNMWDNGEVGNYWSDYTGHDADGDGIGETPHPVYGNFTDRYPLTAPFDINSITVIPGTWNPSLSPEPTPTPIHSPSIEPSPTSVTLPAALLIGFVIAVLVSGLGLLVNFKKRGRDRDL